MIESDARRRLAVAAALSGVAHAALFVFAGPDAPEPVPDSPPLNVRMVTSDVSPQHKPAVRRPPPRSRATRTSTARSADAAPVATYPSQAEPRVAQPAPPEPAPTTEIAQSPPEDRPTEKPSPEAQALAIAPAATVAARPAPLQRLPKKGQASYELVYGRDRFPVGRTIQNWEIDAEGYHLVSRSETTGIIDFWRSQHRNYASRGTVNHDGLRPETFTMSRSRGGRRGIEEARAQFNWDGATVSLGSAAQQRHEALPARSQDLLSFMYQLAINPPAPGRVRQVVTNGTRIEVYELDVLEEETIDTPLGRLRALPIKQVRRSGEESLALWLAVEHRYLPVRVQFFDRAGKSQGEQIITELKVSED